MMVNYIVTLNIKQNLKWQLHFSINLILLKDEYYKLN